MMMVIVKFWHSVLLHYLSFFFISITLQNHLMVLFFHRARYLVLLLLGVKKRAHVYFLTKSLYHVILRFKAEKRLSSLKMKLKLLI